MREINQAGIDLIKTFEGLRLEPYFCSGGKLTIGYGHTGPDVKPLMKITKDKADQLLVADLRSAAFDVSSMVKVPLTDNQFAALVSFVFNFGGPKFKASTLLRRLNEGYYGAVTTELKKWINSGGAPSLGLIRRRKAEIELWEKPVKLNQKEIQP